MLEPVQTPSPPPAPSPHDFAEPMDLSDKGGFGGQGSQTKVYPTGQAPGHHPRQNQVGSVILAGVPIVSLQIEGRERLCLAQISNTLLKSFSYNEIHNRRVALGITCVQCTPVQLEILRRAGAMPISSRRCGMITKREAERLVKSFLEEHIPPSLPENFAFNVIHTCGWACKGSFVPARYNSSRAKCIRCAYCNMFFSPNKFIFHFHRVPEAKYRHPDAANFNSWRRHLFLDYKEPTDELVHAWEDVKAMFNGGSRKRLLTPSKPTNLDPESIKRQRPNNSESMPKMGENNMRFNMLSAGTTPVPTLMSQPPSGHYPTFPALMSPESVFNSETQKLNLANMWKAKTNPYYHPLGLFWAKNLGLFANPVGLSPFGPTAAGQNEDVLAREILMRGKMSHRNCQGIQEEITRESNQGSLGWKHTSAFRPVGGYSRSSRVSSPGMTGFGPGTPADDTCSEHLSNAPLSEQTVSEAEEDNMDDSDINVTDICDTDLNRNDIEVKRNEPEMTSTPIYSSSVVENCECHLADSGGADEGANSHSPQIERASFLETEKEDDGIQEPDTVGRSPSAMCSGSDVPETIMNMSKEELQRELLKMIENRGALNAEAK